MIDWEKVRDVIINSDICDVEYGIADNPYSTKVHCETSIGDIIYAIEDEIEDQIQKILKSIK